MNRTLKLTYITIFLLVLYFPIAMLVANSFNLSVYSVKWEGFTLMWYQRALENFALMSALKNSLILAFSSAFCVTVIATISAFSFYRYQYPGRRIVYFFVQTMVMFPDIILGISLLLLFIIFHIKLGYVTLLIAHISLALPFAIITIFIGFQGLDRNIIEAGKDLGASDYEVFSKIILPIIFPNLVSAYLIAFTLSLDDVVVSYFVSAPDYEILPLIIYSLAKLGIKPEVNAVCASMLVLSVIFIIISQTLIRKKL
ncbi:ABC transporter permease subunit [Candidatus Bandiella euplotis]|uniref:Spermidine/putrescine transport system permease protein PotC n=1 Tax=Candidatus Bandiella euplotis TaxID=1664265 RepID=A0ABZ0UN62_9RICK|nr:ABC transporter permease subunit [Candidatus Bandiella woodruffii]WPX96404.1 ABC transporter permease [Candidatus Bandiella woodruffii]